MKLAKILIAACMLLFVTMFQAHAAEPEPKEKEVKVGGFFSTMNGAIKEFAAKADKDLAASMTKSALEISKNSTKAAMWIGAGLATIYLLYEAMQFMSGKSRSMLTILFDIGIPCTFAALLIKEYATVLNSFEVVLDVLRDLGADNPIEAIMSMYGSVLTNITTTLEQTWANLKGFSLFGSGNQMLTIFDALLTVVFVFIILGLLMLGVAEVLGLLLIGPFLFAVGVAFGPIMIAGIVTPWTRDYFTKWLQFLVISAGLTGVINVIFTLASSIMDNLNMTQYTSDQPTAVSLLILTVLLLTVNSMISQAPSIASALFPGHVGVARSSGQALGSAAKNAKNVAGGARGAANVGARMTGGIAKGTYSISKGIMTKVGGSKTGGNNP